MMRKTFFINTGFTSNGFLNLTPKQAYKELSENKAILLDVRDAAYCAFKSLAVQEVIYLPYDQIKTKYETLPRDKALIIVDSSGLYSKETIIFLIAKNFQNVANLAGCIIEWERDGLPLKENIEERLSGSCMCQLRPRNKTSK